MESSGKIYLEGKLEHKRDLLVCKVSKRQDRLLTGSSDGGFFAVELATLEHSHSFYDVDMVSSVSLTGVTTSPYTDDYITVYTDGWIRFWDSKKENKLNSKINQENQVLGVHASPLAKYIVTCSDDPKLKLFDLETGKEIRVFEASYKVNTSDGHKSRVFAVKFHPTEENELASGGWDNTVQIWDIRKRTSARCLTGPYICGEGLDFDSEGKTLLTCSYRKEENIQLWNYQEGKIMSDLSQEPRSKVYSGKFIYPGLILTTSSMPSALRLIKVDNSAVVSTYRTNLPAMYCADAIVKPSQDGNSLNIIFGAIAGRSLLKLKTTYDIV